MSLLTLSIEIAPGFRIGPFVCVISGVIWFVPEEFWIPSRASVG